MKNAFKDKRNIVIAVITLICVLGVAICISYAYVKFDFRQSEVNIVETSCVKIEMEELSNAISLVNAYPVLDVVGENSQPYQFKLTNICAADIDYSLNLEVLSTPDEKTESNPTGTPRIASKNIAIKIDNLAKKILSTNPATEPTYRESDYTAVEAYKLFSGTIEANSSVMHDLRLWLDQSAGNETQNSKFYSKLVIQAEQKLLYKESILNGADPALK